ncbi:MAG: cytochrome d ubiquinol oxidase subunit II, partial [Silvanigrellaceae bacterium]|nr:cytochrome d ubiquinol oxidase subunit II [Silvanigrellaceae bacterium]
FDLGVGILHPLAKTDEEKRMFLNSIGPFWDGHEVWLVVVGGALFAAFPEAYATAFSGFYLPFIFLLCALIFRAVSIEFRSKRHSKLWRSSWDWSFFVASLTASFLFGSAVGNCIAGIPLDENFEFIGVSSDLFHPYPLLIGLLSVTVFAMHGSIYLYLRLEGSIKEKVHRWIWHTFGTFLLCYIFSTIATLVLFPYVFDNFKLYPWLWLVVALNVVCITNIPRAVFLNKPVQAFASSALSIFTFVALLGIALFPNLIRASNHASHSLTIFNAASSEKTLGIIQLVAFLGMPFVITYTVIIYWVFRGKVKLDKHSY